MKNSSEETWINQIKTLMQDQTEASQEVYNLIAEGLVAHPDSARLWVLRGNLIQLGSENSGYTLTDALESYQQAIRIDPNYAEAYEELGQFYDMVLDDLPAAENAFRQAIVFNAGAPSYAGLARVLAELGKLNEAFASIAPQNCAFSDSAEVIAVRQELEEGVWSPEPG